MCTHNRERERAREIYSNVEIDLRNLLRALRRCFVVYVFMLLVVRVIRLTTAILQTTKETSKNINRGAEGHHDADVVRPHLGEEHMYMCVYVSVYIYTHTYI